VVRRSWFSATSLACSASSCLRRPPPNSPEPWVGGGIRSTVEPAAAGVTEAGGPLDGTAEATGNTRSCAGTGGGTEESTSQNCHPAGAGRHDGSGVQPLGGVQSGGGAGQPGGGLNRYLKVSPRVLRPDRVRIAGSSSFVTRVLGARAARRGWRKQSTEATTIDPAGIDRGRTSTTQGRSSQDHGGRWIRRAFRSGDRTRYVLYRLGWPRSTAASNRPGSCVACLSSLRSGHVDPF
jgi:hypothetical protein